MIRPNLPYLPHNRARTHMYTRTRLAKKERAEQAARKKEEVFRRRDAKVREFMRRQAEQKAADQRRRQQVGQTRAIRNNVAKTAATAPEIFITPPHLTKPRRRSKGKRGICAKSNYARRKRPSIGGAKRLS